MKIFKTYIAPVFLLWIFLIPSAVKIVHKHEASFHCTAKTEKHFHAHHPICFICAFDFFNFVFEKNRFTKDLNSNVIQKVLLPISVFISYPFYLSLLLRSPPGTMVSWHL